MFYLEATLSERNAIAPAGYVTRKFKHQNGNSAEDKVD